MALLKNSKYIKLTTDGHVYIYPSIEARQKHKKATNQDLIIAKYTELIATISDILEFLDC